MKNRIYKLLCVLVTLSLVSTSVGVRASAANKNIRISTRVGELLFGKECEESSVLVGGGIFGVKIKQSYVSIVEAKGIPRLRAGDVILSLGGQDVRSISDIEKIMSASSGEDIKMTVRRGGDCLSVEITPKLSGAMILV